METRRWINHSLPQTLGNAVLQSRLGELVAWGAEVASAAEEAARMSTSLEALREAVERNPAS